MRGVARHGENPAERRAREARTSLCGMVGSGFVLVKTAGRGARLHEAGASEGLASAGAPSAFAPAAFDCLRGFARCVVSGRGTLCALAFLRARALSPRPARHEGWTVFVRSLPHRTRARAPPDRVGRAYAYERRSTWCSATDATICAHTASGIATASTRVLSVEVQPRLGRMAVAANSAKGGSLAVDAARPEARVCRRRDWRGNCRSRCDGARSARRLHKSNGVGTR